jgi:NADH:ubiquinone oxidoreductase subunit 3 (subunit A)
LFGFDYSVILTFSFVFVLCVVWIMFLLFAFLLFVLGCNRSKKRVRVFESGIVPFKKRSVCVGTFPTFVYFIVLFYFVCFLLVFVGRFIGVVFCGGLFVF